MLPQTTHRLTPQAPRHFRRCSHCGHVGQDVIEVSDYIGGKGYVTSYKCRDAASCWHRWDKAHGLAV
jgi:hypothetical protein